jgi:hypothetical protein
MAGIISLKRRHKRRWIFGEQSRILAESKVRWPENLARAGEGLWGEG